MITLKPQDIVILLKLGLTADPGNTPLAKLGAEIGISASEFHGALKRTAAAALLDLEHRRPRVSPFLEFLEHGLRYVFISRRGEITRGIPTAHSARPLSELLRVGPVARMYAKQAAGRTAQMYEQMPEHSSSLTLHESTSATGRTAQMYEQMTVVWPHPHGDVRGESLEPLYPSAVDAALRDRALYESLTLVDALRIGRARERKLAIDLLAKRFVS